MWGGLSGGCGLAFIFGGGGGPALFIIYPVRACLIYPAWALPGEARQISHKGKSLRFTIPPNVAPGGLVRVPIPPELIDTPETLKMEDGDAINAVLR